MPWKAWLPLMVCAFSVRSERVDSVQSSCQHSDRNHLSHPLFALPAGFTRASEDQPSDAQSAFRKAGIQETLSTKTSVVNRRRAEACPAVSDFVAAVCLGLQYQAFHPAFSVGFPKCPGPRALRPPVGAVHP